MYTHTHGVCKPLCRGRVDGGRRGRHHNASTHTPTIPICCHAVSPLSLSLYPFSRSSTCVYIVLYAIQEPVAPVTREPLTHTRGSSCLPPPRRKYINCPRSRRYRQLLLPLLRRADFPTRLYYVSRPVPGAHHAVSRRLASHPRERRHLVRAPIGQEQSADVSASDQHFASAANFRSTCRRAW